MKGWLAKHKGMTLLAVTLLLAALMIGIASAETAIDLTENCELALDGKSSCKNLTDKKFTSYLESKSVKNPALTVSSKEPLYGIYLCFQKMPAEYEL